MHTSLAVRTSLGSCVDWGHQAAAAEHKQVTWWGESGEWGSERLGRAELIAEFRTPVAEAELVEPSLDRFLDDDAR